MTYCSTNTPNVNSAPCCMWRLNESSLQSNRLRVPGAALLAVRFRRYLELLHDSVVVSCNDNPLDIMLLVPRQDDELLRVAAEDFKRCDRHVELFGAVIVRAFADEPYDELIKRVAVHQISRMLADPLVVLLEDEFVLRAHPLRISVRSGHRFPYSRKRL